MDSLKGQLIEATDLFKKATDALKKKEREIIEYYAVDLTDMAAIVVNSWLLLQDALVSDRKRDLARFYIIENLPRVHAAGDTILAADNTPLLVRDTVLAEEF
jgi:hypothetical protein